MSFIPGIRIKTKTRIALDLERIPKSMKRLSEKMRVKTTD